MVYTGSYMVRHIEGQQDYSNYMRSFVGSYYACIGTGAGYFNQNNFPSADRAPAAVLYRRWATGTTRCATSTRARRSASAPMRTTGCAACSGAYWEKFVIDDNMNFNYLGIPQCSQANLDIALGGGPDCLSAVGPTPGTFAGIRGCAPNANTAFGEDVQRGYKQTAFFTSIDFDLIPKVLTITGGMRWYQYDEFEHGSEYFSESTSTGLVVNHLNGACTAAGLCGFPINLDKSESGYRWRGNLTWHVTPTSWRTTPTRRGSVRAASTAPTRWSGQPPILSGVARYCGNINGAQSAPGPALPARRQPARSQHQPVQQAGGLQL